MNEYEGRWSEGCVAVPMNGLTCWLKWPDGTHDGPFPALALLLRTAKLTVGVDHLDEDDTMKDGRIVRRRIYEQPPGVSRTYGVDGEFSDKWVVLGMPPEYEYDTFKLRNFDGDEPQVHWKEPV